MMQLRDYQTNAINDLLNWFKENKTGNPVVNAAVGAGKSIMLAALCDKAVNGYKSKLRILIVTPTKELCEQNYQKLENIGDNLKIGVMSASLKRKDNVDDKDVVIGTIGTLYKQGLHLGLFNLVLIDEAHLVNRKNQGIYRKLINTLAIFNKNIRVIGWTGSPFRYDGVWITEGDNRLFTDIPINITMKQLLDDGYLAPIKTAKTSETISANGLTVRNGDYVISELEALLDNEETNQRIALNIVKIGIDRSKWLVFCVGIKHAENMSIELNKLGIKTEVVTGETPRAQRDLIVKQFRNGLIKCICNCAVLTTGFDCPEIDLIALVRNTKSKVLYTQIIGRGMRIAEGKVNCLWLDFTDTTRLLGPVDLLTGISEKQKKQGGASPSKTCPDCEAVLHASYKACPDCGHEFPEATPKINLKPSKSAVLSTDYTPEWHPVDRVTYSRWPGKDGKPDTMRVDYWDDTSGLWPVKIASEFVCVFHPVGWAREKAKKWCARVGLDIESFHMLLDVADKRDAGLGDFSPSRILLNTRGKFAQIVDYDFASRQDHEAA